MTLKKALTAPQLIFQQCPLEYVPTHKHLGSTLSNIFGWSVHINTVVNKSFQNRFAFVIGKQTLSHMYINSIRPLLEYACEVWDGGTQFEMEQLNCYRVTRIFL